MSKTQVVRLSGDLDSNTLHEVAATVTKDLEEDVSVEVVQKDFTVGSDISDVPAIAAILTATIKAILYARQSIKARSWDERRLLDVIRSALAQRGVTEYQVIDIKNLGGLRGRGTDPCTIVVQSSSGVFQVNVFIDGTVLTFSLASSLPDLTETTNPEPRRPQTR